MIGTITLGDYPAHADHCSSVEVTSVGAAACGRMQVAYAIACVVVHQRAHQLVARHSPVPVGEMLFATGFISGLLGRRNHERCARLVCSAGSNRGFIRSVDDLAQMEIAR